MMNRKKIILLGASALLFACGTPNKSTTKETKGSSQLNSINVDYFDTTTLPSEDFFQFANGNWIANNPIPSSESRWSSFNELDQLNKKRLTKILNKAVEAKAEEGSDLQFVGDYYTSMKDFNARERLTQKYIKEIKDELAAFNSKEELPSMIYQMKEKGIGALYSLYVSQDLKNVENHILYLSQGGLGLPNREYYFQDSKADIRDDYLNYIKNSLTLFGDIENTDEVAKDILEFETTLAEKMMKPEELRVPENTYNPMEIGQAKNMKDFIHIEKYLKEFNGDDVKIIVVRQPEYFKNLSVIIDKTELSTLKNYITWKYVNHYAYHFDEKFSDLKFGFYGTTLSGTKERKPINEQAIEEMTSNPVKTALAKLFVEEYFPEESKEKVNTMVDNLLRIYEGRIKDLDWMSENTKVEALKKLESIERKLGYPDKWEDLSRLKITAEDYIANVDACNYYSYSRNMSKLNQPVDRDEWAMPAHLVNAYYHPLLNEIAFPAGIMQPPFFDIEAEDAVNYGGIGMVIGHEFTHGFDDMGSKFAADGSFSNWWSEEDRERFEEKTNKLGNTFEQFCPIDGYCVNPDLTMGENIADLGGITLAYHAYTLTDEFKKGEVINGFTPAQRFFIAYAQLWKINYTEAELKKRIMTDPHSPGKYRVNGPLMNCPEFFEAFDIKEGSPMRNSADKISIIW